MCVYYNYILLLVRKSESFNLQYKMWNGWFGSSAAAEAPAPVPMERGTGSDSDGEFVVVHDSPLNSVCPRAINNDAAPVDQPLQEPQPAEVSTLADEQSGVGQPNDTVEENPTSTQQLLEEEVADLSIARPPCPDLVDAVANPPTEEAGETDTEVDTVADEDAPAPQQQTSSPEPEAVQEMCTEEERSYAAPVEELTEEDKTSARGEDWVDVPEESPAVSAPNFEDCQSALISKEASKAVFFVASSAAAASSSPPPDVFAWGCPGTEIIIADLDVAEQELLSEILSTGSPSALADDTIRATQMGECLSPEQLQCLSVLIPPVSTANEATYVCWNIARALDMAAERVEVLGAMVETPDDIQQLMILHSLLARVAPTPDPSHHIAIAALLIRQSKMDNRGELKAAPILRQLKKAVDDGFTQLDVLCGDERFAALHGFVEFDGFIADALVDWEPVLKVQSLLNHRGSNSIKICDILAHLFQARGDADKAAESLQSLYF